VFSYQISRQQCAVPEFLKLFFSLKSRRFTQISQKTFVFELRLRLRTRVLRSMAVCGNRNLGNCHLEKRLASLPISGFRPGMLDFNDLLGLADYSLALTGDF